MLQVDKVTVDLGGFTILRDLSLEVQTGSIVGLIGRNGAGKTTTLRSIMGLISARSGQIRLDGQDLRPLSGHERAKLGIGFMPEYRGLISALTAEQNIMLPAWAMGLSDAQERLAIIYRLMPEVRQLASRPGMALSGGQQKLVALARSFMSGRKLLLLDEPFEGVAPALAQRLVRAVQEYKRDEARELSVVVAQSEFKWARMLADKIYVIERGETTEETSLSAQA